MSKQTKKVEPSDIEKAKALLEANGHKVSDPKMGRPTEYDPRYCDLLIDHMEKGLSFESFAGVVRCSNKTLYNWAEANPDFLHAKEIGTAQCRLYWEMLGNSGASGLIPGFNAASFKFNMANRFKWTDRIDATSGGKKLPEGGIAPVIIALPTNGREQKK